MLKNFKMLSKQLIGFGLVTVIALVIGFIGYREIHHQRAELESVLKTAPLIDAAMEMKLSVARDMRIFMEILSADRQSALDEYWSQHLENVKTFDQYAKAIHHGAQTAEGVIYATSDQKLKGIVGESDRFHKDQFQSRMKKGYDSMSRKIAGEAVGQEVLDALDDEVDGVGQKMLALLGGVEAGAKTQIESAKSRALKASRNASIVLLLSVLIGVSAALVLGFVFARMITMPIRQAVEHAERMATGDFSRSLEFTHGDEIGMLAKALNRTTASLRVMIGDITSGAQTLTASSNELSAISEQMNQSSEAAAQECGGVAAATEQMSANMTSVASASEQLSTNIQMVATAAEEMSATVAEIAKNSETASTITTSAVSKASSATRKVGELGASANEISKVTETITEISEQTNLLALNATIEAARAGEAGKGFAVVANEIKELARQTAQATAEIKSRIDGIQTSTAGTVAEIQEISKVIHDVNEIVSTIAAAVEEQSVTTRDIVENISQASQGVQEVNQNISQSSHVSSGIARDIGNVNQSNRELSNASAQVLASSKELSGLAEQLNRMIRQFHLE